MIISNEDLEKLILRLKGNSKGFVICMSNNMDWSYLVCKCGHIHQMGDKMPKSEDIYVDTNVILNIFENRLLIYNNMSMVKCPNTGDKFLLSSIHNKTQIYCYTMRLMHILQMNGYIFPNHISNITYNTTTDITNPTLQVKIQNSIKDFQKKIDKDIIFTMNELRYMEIIS